MAYTYTSQTVEGDWEVIAADVTTVSVLQIKQRGSSVKPELELMVAASLPSASDTGIGIDTGEAMTSMDIEYLGITGALYGRATSFDAAGNVRPVQLLVVTTA